MSLPNRDKNQELLIDVRNGTIGMVDGETFLGGLGGGVGVGFLFHNSLI